MSAFQITIIAVDKYLPTAITGLQDLFWLTNKAAEHARLKNFKRFTVTTANVTGEHVAYGRGGQVIPVDTSIHNIENCDIILIPGLIELDSKSLLSQQNAKDGLCAWLRKKHALGLPIGASCAGVFILGAAGLLNGRRCTTTWWLHNKLSTEYAKANVIWGAGLQNDNNVITVGGPMSWIDLGLYTIRMLAGKDMARIAADFAVIDNVPINQSIYAPQNYVSIEDPLLIEAETIVRNHKGKISVSDLSSQLNLTEKTFYRRLKQLTGEAPTVMITRVKLDIVRALIERDGIPSKRAASIAGYTNENAFRRAFKRTFGKSPADYRAWAKNRYAP